jgi:hypothetical protein
MGALHWDETHQVLAGRWLRVPAPVFQAAVDAAVAEGMPEAAAILLLLDEDAWSHRHPGVTVLPPATDLTGADLLLRRVTTDHDVAGP